MQERSRVLQLVKAVSSRNWGLIARVSRGLSLDATETAWTPAGLLALQLWLVDALAGTEESYTAAEKFGLDRLPTVFLTRALAVSQTDCRPSIAVALAVMALAGI